MPDKYENKAAYHIPWYVASANGSTATLGRLTGEVNCDICVIGGGFTGLSAAYELSKQGFSVTLLEAGGIASSASGRNGGQVMRGFAKGPDVLISKLGRADAKMLCDLSLDAIAMMKARISAHAIACDYTDGQLSAAIKPRHMDELKAERDIWASLGHDDMTLLDTQETQKLVKTQLYTGGLLDDKSGFFHPFNYAQGLAAAAIGFGCKIHDDSRALRLVLKGAKPRVETAQGAVNAAYVILGGAIALEGSTFMIRRSITATAHMIATAPLGQDRMDAVMSRPLAVCDTRFIMDYYRPTADGRMLFGGNCNYSDRAYPGEAVRLKARMAALFPALADAPIEHCWHGPLEFTINRLPHLGRLSPCVYYAHGFGGQGVVATNLAGQVLAEAVAGTAAHFDVFAKIKHAPFAGGDALKRPLFVLGMTWFRLRDALGL